MFVLRLQYLKLIRSILEIVPRVGQFVSQLLVLLDYLVKFLLESIVILALIVVASFL